MRPMPQLNLSGAWRGGCHPPVLGRKSYLQGVHLMRCGAHAGASSCCVQFVSGEAVTLSLPMGIRNSWSTFQSKHIPVTSLPTLIPSPFPPWAPAPSATGLCFHPELPIPVLHPCPSKLYGLLAEISWAGKISVHPIA